MGDRYVLGFAPALRFLWSQILYKSPSDETINRAPPCVYKCKKDHIRAMKMSEFGGLCQQQNNPARTERVSFHHAEVEHYTNEEEEEEEEHGPNMPRWGKVCPLWSSLHVLISQNSNADHPRRTRAISLILSLHGQSTHPANRDTNKSTSSLGTAGPCGQPTHPTQR